jgi:hypothetical protein
VVDSTPRQDEVFRSCHLEQYVIASRRRGNPHLRAKLLKTQCVNDAGLPVLLKKPDIPLNKFIVRTYKIGVAKQSPDGIKALMGIAAVTHAPSQ